MTCTEMARQEEYTLVLRHARVTMVYSDMYFIKNKKRGVQNLKIQRSDKKQKY